MSMTNLGPNAALPTDIVMDAWRHMFGGMIQDVRESAGRSIEQAAQLAGMEPLDWAAVEDGSIVADPAWLRPMADTLELPFDQMQAMLYLCQYAWPQ